MAHSDHIDDRVCAILLCQEAFQRGHAGAEAELGISKVQLGIFLTLNGIIYGISRFVNGFLADRFSRRKLMSLGLVLSAVTNLVICFSPSMNSFMNVLDTEGKATMTLVYIIGTLWVLNGYFQGMGVHRASVSCATGSGLPSLPPSSPSGTLPTPSEPDSSA